MIVKINGLYAFDMSIGDGVRQTESNLGSSLHDSHSLTPSHDEQISSISNDGDYHSSEIHSDYIDTPDGKVLGVDNMPYQHTEGIQGFPDQSMQSVESQGFIDGTKEFLNFMHEVKAEGLSHAIWGKSFFQVILDGFTQFVKDLGMFVVHNGDIIFLAPAIGFMFVTFFVGKNKYSKYIVPAWFGYFITTILSHTM